MKAPTSYITISPSLLFVKKKHNWPLDFLETCKERLRESRPNISCRVWMGDDRYWSTKTGKLGNQSSEGTLVVSSKHWSVWTFWCNNLLLRMTSGTVRGNYSTLVNNTPRHMWKTTTYFVYVYGVSVSSLIFM